MGQSPLTHWEKGVSKVGEEKNIYPLYDFHNYLYASELPIEGCRFIPLSTLYLPSMIRDATKLFYEHELPGIEHEFFMNLFFGNGYQP